MNDCIVFKVTLFAAISDSVGTYAMWHFGTGVNPHAKPMTSSSMFFFWMIFGAGMGLLDYYPGTGIGVSWAIDLIPRTAWAGGCAGLRYVV